MAWSPGCRVRDDSDSLLIVWRACGRRVVVGAAMVLALVASLHASAAAQDSGSYADVPADADHTAASVRTAATVEAQGIPYTDVSKTHVFRDQIEALFHRGVFTGTDCGEELFCPSQAIKRWQVAVWLVRVRDGRDPLPLEESRFADVDDDVWWMPYVERLADLGVTGGCRLEPLRFCPETRVTRAQMASFLVRAFGLAPGPDAGFEDVAQSNTHYANINALAASKVTTGCHQEPLRFCPSRPTTKGQMAAFLHRALTTNSLGIGTEDNELSRWVKSAIVDQYGAEAPWLTEVWNYTDRRSFLYIPEVHPTTNTHGTVVSRFTTGGGSVFPQVESYKLYADRAAINNPLFNSVLIHELAHVYTIDGSNAAKNPEALAAGWLYFDSIAGSHCDPFELYAETAEALEPFGQRDLKQSRWWECPNLPSIPTDEAVEVVGQAFSGRLPDWFHERFQSKDGTWAYEEIWREVKYSSPDVRKIIVPMLRRSFGGYCSEEAVRQTLFASERRPHLSQPWRDGGCEELRASTNPEFLTEENELSRWVKSAVIDEYGDRWPWLNEAWDYTNRPNFKYLPAGDSGGWKYPYQYIWAWREPEETGDVFRLLASDGLSVAKNTIKNNYLHEPTYELARMYIHNYDLARNPEAVVAGWLYFISIAGYDCNPTALYIDTAISLESDFIDKEYWWEWEWAICNHLPDEPTAEALQVARQVFSGQIPDWFHANFKDTSGQWDYQEIWSAVINATNYRDSMLPMLRYSFGGYCSEQAIADANRLMSALGSDFIITRMVQPWHDGGCGQKLRVESNDANRPPTGTEYVTEENELSRWIKDDIIDKYASRAPWLREIWNYTNREDFQYVVAPDVVNSILWTIFRIGSARQSTLIIGEGDLPYIESQKIYVSERLLNKPTGLPYLISELAHVYIIDSTEVANNPEAVAAGWLYFASLAGRDCNPVLLYAHTVATAHPFDDSFESRGWSLCPHLPNQPTAEAKEVVRQAFSGQIPDWFYDNFQKKKGEWDYEKIWTAVKNSPIHAQIAVVQMLRRSFGGYCSEAAIVSTLFVTDPQTPLDQPWRDGGC